MRAKRSVVLLVVLMTALLAAVWLHETRATRGPGFTVMSFNIGDSDYEFPKAAAVAAVVKAAGTPDVLLLQELRGSARLAELKRLLGYKHAVLLNYKRTGHVFLAVLSRYPIRQPARMYFDESAVGSGAVGGIIDVAGQSVLVVSTHLDQVRSKQRDSSGYVDESEERTIRILKREILNDNVRAHQSAQLIDWLAARGCVNVVVGGDFNTVSLARAVRQMRRHYDDALWLRLDYFTGTYQKVRSDKLPRIDFIFVSPNLKAYNGRVIRSSPGDHYPVWTGVALGR